MSRQILTPAIKRKITKDWNELFPNFSMFKPMSLLRRTGPLLIGITLERGSGNDFYTPVAHVHCLASEFPVITLTLGAETLYVSANIHEKCYIKRAEELKSKAYIPLEGIITIDEVIKGYNKGIQIQNQMYPEDLYRERALILGWAGRIEQANATIQKAEKVMKKWPKNVLDQIGGLDNWIEALSAKVRDKGTLQEIVSLEVSKHKLTKIPDEGLT